jgi:hypothetical protein
LANLTAGSLNSAVYFVFCSFSHFEHTFYILDILVGVFGLGPKNEGAVAALRI